MEECDDGNDVEDDLCTSDCSSNGIFYNATITAGQAGGQACTDWNTWRADLDVGFAFSRIAMTSTIDQTGKECTGPEADQICQALSTGQALNIQCDGQAWSVAECSGTELAVGGSCQCQNPAYTIRICHPTPGYQGGIGSNNCANATQDVQVVCQ
jgi:hypothetical protein